MNEEAFDRGGRIPTFDGNIQNFPNWWKKFSAYATMARIKSILKEERDANLPEKEVSNSIWFLYNFGFPISLNLYHHLGFIASFSSNVAQLIIHFS
jgi:hypothetical protein